MAHKHYADTKPEVVVKSKTMRRGLGYEQLGCRLMKHGFGAGEPNILANTGLAKFDNAHVQCDEHALCEYVF